MAKLILLVALAFSITTGSITMLILKSSARDGVPWQQRALDSGIYQVPALQQQHGAGLLGSSARGCAPRTRCTMRRGFYLTRRF